MALILETIVMNDFVEKIERAVHSGDRAEIKRIIHNLVVVGACDHRRAQEILTSSSPN